MKTAIWVSIGSAITWNIVDFSWGATCDIHLQAILQKIVMNLIHNMYGRLLSHLPGTNELIICVIDRIISDRLKVGLIC